MSFPTSLPFNTRIYELCLTSDRDVSWYVVASLCAPPGSIGFTLIMPIMAPGNGSRKDLKNNFRHLLLIYDLKLLFQKICMAVWKNSDTLHQMIIPFKKQRNLFCDKIIYCFYFLQIILSAKNVYWTKSFWRVYNVNY